MICRACLRRAPNALRLPAQSANLLRPFSSSAVSRAEDAAPTFSNPLSAHDVSHASASAAAPSVVSSCPAGTVLVGLNYFKGRNDPVALPDNEYPDWLWTCLETERKEAALDDGAGDEFSKSKKQRKMAAKRRAAEEARLLAEGNLEALAPKIPLQHQSINLPGSPDDGIEDTLLAAEKREELRKAMRRERRAKIKESNYLRSM